MENMQEIVQYIVVNKELGMSTGKTAAQVGHVVTLSTLKYQDTEEFQTWLANGQVKILLGGKLKDLLKLKEQGFIHIEDFGRTEIPEGSLTAIALPPMTREHAKVYVKRIQSLKDKKEEK